MSGRMHQTTVRFGADLWQELEIEAARTGVSAAQYVRDATLARLAFNAGQRSGADGFAGEHGREAGERANETGSAPASRRSQAGEQASETRSESDAVWAQAKLARERAATMREQAKEIQAQIRDGRRPKAAAERVR